MKRSLISLALGTFALGIAEFATMGILGDLASDLDVDISTAGHLITAYSLGVAVGAPALILLRKRPLKSIMMFLAAMITIGNALAALAPNFHILLGARFISGLPHGAFFGTGAIVCSRLASKGGGATAIAVMVAGMTVANVIGVPGATFISGVLSWRMAFACVALAAMLAFILMKMWLPYMEPLPDTGIRGQFAFLRSAAPWLIYAGVFFGQAGVYCWFSYIEPIMTDVTGFSTPAMTWIMMLAGIGMVCGNFTAGRLADRFRPSNVSGCIALLIIVLMIGLYFLSAHKAISLVLMFLATACLFGIGGPPQYLIVRFSRGGEMLGGAGIQIAFNVSNAVSASLGSAVIAAGYGIDAPTLVGIPMAALGATAFFILGHKFKNQNT